MTNPFFEDWTAPYGAPPLDRIAPEHFAPAYDRALAEHSAEIVAIAENPAAPSFENVVVALEKSGQLLTRVEGVFHNLAAAATNGDIFVLQDESNTTNLSQYVSLYTSAAAQASAANSGVSVYSEVSTANGTAAQMTAATESISPDGMYVAAPGATAQADQFFQNMQAAGY